MAIRGKERPGKSAETKMHSDRAKPGEDIITLKVKNKKKKRVGKWKRDLTVTEESKIDESRSSVDQVSSLNEDASRETKKKSKSDRKMKRKGLYGDKGGKLEDRQNDDGSLVDQLSPLNEDAPEETTKKSKSDRKRKRMGLCIDKAGELVDGQHDTDSGEVDNVSLAIQAEEKKAGKRRKDLEILAEDAGEITLISSVDEDCSRGMQKKSTRDRKRKRKGLHIDKGGKQGDSQHEIDSGKVDEVSLVIEAKKNKDDKIRKDFGANEEMEMKERQGEDAREIGQISLVDEDCSRGMKKWLTEYKESRPGLKILQQKIDEYITSYEEKQEQEKREKEERIAEDGWTVVVQHKGRKKTTDSESGIAVGSVAPAAVMDNKVKEKNKELPDFYRFQKREARRSEVMMLQSKFEEDKRRIQQLRAQRKFRPY